MHLERTFKVQIQLPDELEERFALADDRSHERKYRPHAVASDCRFAIKPGFVLQESAKNTFFNFNGGSVQVKSEWLGPFAKLHRRHM